MALVCEPDRHGDLGDVLTSPQQPSRLVDADLDQVAGGGQPEMRLEAIDQRRLGASGEGGQGGELQNFVKVGMDEVTYVAEPRWHEFWLSNARPADLCEDVGQETDQMLLDLQCRAVLMFKQAPKRAEAVRNRGILLERAFEVDRSGFVLAAALKDLPDKAFGHVEDLLAPAKIVTSTPEMRFAGREGRDGAATGVPNLASAPDIMDASLDQPDQILVVDMLGEILPVIVRRQVIEPAKDIGVLHHRTIARRPARRFRTATRLFAAFYGGIGHLMINPGWSSQRYRAVVANFKPKQD